MKLIALLTVVVLAVVLAGAAFLLRSNRLTADKLCQILYVRISAADQALGTRRSSTFDYFQQHPDALKAAHREDRVTLKSLPCTPP